ncbi:MAG: tyrosine-type recombinase/integrase, partial [Acidimicrobiales bacterium]
MAGGWAIDGFAQWVAGRSPATVRAYRGDVTAFAEWAERSGCAGPADVGRLLLRRYLAYLGTRRYARATVARKAAALRAYFGWCRRRGLVDTDPSRSLTAQAAAGRLPTVLSPAELGALLDPPAGVPAGGDGSGAAPGGAAPG